MPSVTCKIASKIKPEKWIEAEIGVDDDSGSKFWRLTAKSPVSFLSFNVTSGEWFPIARWSDAHTRRGPLTPYGRDAESKTLELLEDALRPSAGRRLTDTVATRLQASIAQDIADLLPHLETRGQEGKLGAEKLLAKRGHDEAAEMRRTGHEIEAIPREISRK